MGMKFNLSLLFSKKILYIIFWFILLFIIYFIFNSLNNFYYKDINQAIFISFWALIIPWYFSKFNVWMKKILIFLSIVFMLFLIFNIDDFNNKLKFNSFTTFLFFIIIFVVLTIIFVIGFIKIYNEAVPYRKINDKKITPILQFLLFITFIVCLLALIFISIFEKNYISLNKILIPIIWVDFFQFLNNFLFWILIGTIYEVSMRLIDNKQLDK